MFIKSIIGLSAAIVLAAASTAPASAGSSKVRTARPAPASLPPPAYGIRLDGQAHSSNPAHDVYLGYKYSGSDPDPQIRSKLAQDPPWNASR
jgi:hypothetical protein